MEAEVTHQLLMFNILSSTDLISYQPKPNKVICYLEFSFNLK